MYRKPIISVFVLGSFFGGLLSFAAEPTLQSRAKDAAQGTPWADHSLACYVVPPISSVKRLPDTLPSDGKLSDQLYVVAAKGELEPVSFVIVPFEDFAKVKVNASALKGKNGSIPAENVDIKVVKCWYQGGTAWHSYFADSAGRAKIPELLLNDENLIRVDDDTQENYLRIDYPSGSQYRWVSFPENIRGNLSFFNHVTEPVADAKTLQPIRLEAGSAKQLWITIKVPEDAEAGYYSGTIDLEANGKKLGVMNLNVRALPFSLPVAKTYYDLNQDFYTSLYAATSSKSFAAVSGGDTKSADAKVLAEYQNMQKHNVFSPLVGTSNAGRRQLELMKEADLRTDPIFGAVSVYNWEVLYRYLVKGKEIPPAIWQAYEKAQDDQIALLKEVLGHANAYGIGYDEPGRSVLEAEQKLFESLHRKGLGVYSTAKDKHLQYAGFNEDIANYSGSFKSASAKKWHVMGAKIFSYASPHAGPENPDLIRRTHGLGLYKSDYDGTCNYKYYELSGCVWNDFDNGSYRICFIYPTKTGVIDTLHWEGFREGIDDIRYATLLRQLAEKAIATGGVERRYASKKALQYLALLDENKADLTEARLEMINHILKIQGLMKGEI